MLKRPVLRNLMLAALLGLLTGWWIWYRPKPTGGAGVEPASLPAAASTMASSPAAAVAPLPDAAASGDEQNNIEVYKAASSTVVNITSTTIQYDFFFNVLPVQGSGSGFQIGRASCRERV